MVVEMDTSAIQELGNAPTWPELSTHPPPLPAGNKLKLKCKSPAVGKFSGNVVEWDDWQNSFSMHWLQLGMMKLLMMNTNMVQTQKEIKLTKCNQRWNRQWVGD